MMVCFVLRAWALSKYFDPAHGVPQPTRDHEDEVSCS